MTALIEPKVLKGFRDFLPENELTRRRLTAVLEKQFRSYGFVPIDTPVLEYSDVLLSKNSGETEKQTYRFTDKGGRDVALRFDLTVPFARYLAAHKRELDFPFKRYHMAKAWRGENPQKGRYREFIQCDFDIVGVDSLGADLEIILMIQSSLEALKAGDFEIRFNHRGIFNLFLEHLGLEDQSPALLRIVDKLPKIGVEKVQRLLEEITGPGRAASLVEYITPAASSRQTLAKMGELAGAREHPLVENTARFLELLEETGNPSVLDPRITRGLDYYTGLVFETFLTPLPGFGSVCSGGRYNDLTGRFTKEPLPGVGASVGLDRLMAGLEELGALEKPSPSADILVLLMDEDLLGLYIQTARELRNAGLAVELYPEKKKLAAQFKFADAKNIPLALIMGSREAETKTMTLKDLRTRENREGLSLPQAVAEAKKRILSE